MTGRGGGERSVRENVDRRERGWGLKKKKSARSWVIWSDRVTVSEASGVHKGMPVE